MLCTARQATVEVDCLMAKTVSPQFEALRTASLPLKCPAQPNGQRTCLPAKSVHGGSLLARGRRPRPSCTSGTATPISACSRSLLWQLQPGQVAAQPIHLHDAVQQVLCAKLPGCSCVPGCFGISHAAPGCQCCLWIPLKPPPSWPPAAEASCEGCTRLLHTWSSIAEMLPSF